MRYKYISLKKNHTASPPQLYFHLRIDSLVDSNTYSKLAETSPSGGTVGDLRDKTNLPTGTWRTAGNLARYDETYWQQGRLRYPVWWRKILTGGLQGLSSKPT